MLYTRKINPILSDIQNRIFDFEVAARDMMNFEWSYIFPRSQIHLPFFFEAWRSPAEKTHSLLTLRGSSKDGRYVHFPMFYIKP